MKLGTVYDITFSTNRADTGALSSADSTPVVRVTENGVNLAYLPTVSTLSTWVYLVSIDTAWANGFEVGKRYSVYCTATVNAIDGATGLDSFTVETRNIDDVLPTSWYTAPDNATISAIQTEVNSHPTLAEIEASTILAKEATIPTVWEIRTELSPELLLITTNLDAKVSEAGWAGGWLTEAQDKHLMKLRNWWGGAIVDFKSIEDWFRKAQEPFIRSIDAIPLAIKESEENVIESIWLAKTDISNNLIATNTEITNINTSINSLSENNPIWEIKGIVTDGTNKIQRYLWKIEEMEKEKKILSESDELDSKAKEIQSKKIEKEIERINIELENMYSQEAEMLQEQVIEKEILSINL